uniref:NB-ARC domain-containing protein n=1 Tax=Steinernema glaseri TaxID=37863 RepID=A0A1I7ZY68_9BILA
MNRLPAEFYERVCELPDGSILLEAEKLSGIFGKYAQKVWQQRTCYVGLVENGVEKTGYLVYQSSRREVRSPEEIQAVPKKFVKHATIHLLDGKEENVSRAIVKRFPNALYAFIIYSPSINEAWVDFACSLDRLHSIFIVKKLEEEAIQLFKKLVNARRLSKLQLYGEACEGGILELLKSVFCQDQFVYLRISKPTAGPWNSAIVRTLLQHWADNSEKLDRKRLVLEGICEGGVQQLEEFLLQRASPSLPLGTTDSERSSSHPGMHSALKVCSEEECQHAGQKFTRFIKPSCVYKYEEGEGDDLRRIYISFECANEEERRTGQKNRIASHRGHDDLSLMRATNQIRLFFA